MPKKKKKIIYVCEHCKSTLITRIAYQSWDVDIQQWEDDDVSYNCSNCLMDGNDSMDALEVDL